MAKLRDTLSTYLNEVAAVLSHGKQTVELLGKLLGDDQQQHRYTMIQIRAENAWSSSADYRLSQTLLEQVLGLLDDCAVIERRVAARAEMVAELDYYTAKVAKLKAAVIALQAKNKWVEEEDALRYHRNAKVLEDLQKVYAKTNTQLIIDMHVMWKGRERSVGPILAAWVQAEKRLMGFLGDAFSLINTESKHKFVPPTRVGLTNVSALSRQRDGGRLKATEVASASSSNPFAHDSFGSSTSTNPFGVAGGACVCLSSFLDCMSVNSRR